MRKTSFRLSVVEAKMAGRRVEMMSTNDGVVEHGGVIDLAVLVYEEDHSGNPIWFARSVMTSDVVHAETREQAVCRLERLIEVALAASEKRGVNAEEWLEQQVPDDPKWLALWCREWLAGEAVETHDASVRLKLSTAVAVMKKDAA